MINTTYLGKFATRFESGISLHVAICIILHVFKGAVKSVLRIRMLLFIIRYISFYMT